MNASTCHTPWSWLISSMREGDMRLVRHSPVSVSSKDASTTPACVEEPSLPSGLHQTHLLPLVPRHGQLGCMAPLFHRGAPEETLCRRSTGDHHPVLNRPQQRRRGHPPASGARVNEPCRASKIRRTPTLFMTNFAQFAWPRRGGHCVAHASLPGPAGAASFARQGPRK